MSPKWMRSFAARDEVSERSRLMVKQFRGRERAGNPRLISTRRFVYVDKRGSLNRLHTSQRGGEDMKII